MRRHLLLPNLRLRHALLVRTHRRDHTQRARVDLRPPIAHNAHHDLLPPVLPPRLAAVALAQVRDVADDAVHRAAEELLVLVVHRHHDEELRAPRRVVVHLAEREAGVFEVVWVAGRGGVPHVRELAVGAVRAHVQEFFRHCVV